MDTVYLNGKYMNEDFLDKRLKERQEQGAYRQLRLPDNKIDFSSNDYLGIAKNGLLKETAIPDPASMERWHGATGSRLLSGNYPLIQETENLIANFHDAPCGLFFNSGYDANLGLLSAIPQRGDTIIYDQLSHASIRDGISLSFAQSHSFIHNDIIDLKQKLKLATGTLFVVTESVFSMDGHVAPLEEMAEICKEFNANLVVDEAHATGVLGKKGEGLAQQLGIHKACFARVHTFGKALGCHGAIVLGSELLRNYLINFSRPFIYTTAIPAANIAAVKKSYEIFPSMQKERDHLVQLVEIFQKELSESVSSTEKFQVMSSPTPIQAVIVSGNHQVKKFSGKLSKQGFDIRPILYPTVPKGMERLRIVLHSFNTADQLMDLIGGLRNFEALDIQ